MKRSEPFSRNDDSLSRTSVGIITSRPRSSPGATVRVPHAATLVQSKQALTQTVDGPQKDRSPHPAKTAQPKSSRGKTSDECVRPAKTFRVTELTLQRSQVAPARPEVDTNTLKGKVIDRALDHVSNEAKYLYDLARWVFKCFHCKKWITEEAVTADHYPIPQSNEDCTDDLNNLVLACVPCNTANIHNKQQMVTRGKDKKLGEERKYTD